MADFTELEAQPATGRGDFSDLEAAHRRRGDGAAGTVVRYLGRVLHGAVEPFQEAFRAPAPGEMAPETERERVAREAPAVTGFEHFPEGLPHPERGAAAAGAVVFPAFTAGYGMTKRALEPLTGLVPETIGIAPGALGTGFEQGTEELPEGRFPLRRAAEEVGGMIGGGGAVKLARRLVEAALRRAPTALARAIAGEEATPAVAQAVPPEMARAADFISPEAFRRAQGARSGREASAYARDLQARENVAEEALARRAAGQDIAERRAFFEAGGRERPGAPEMPEDRTAAGLLQAQEAEREAMQPENVQAAMAEDARLANALRRARGIGPTRLTPEEEIAMRQRFGAEAGEAEATAPFGAREEAALARYYQMQRRMQEIEDARREAGLPPPAAPLPKPPPAGPSPTPEAPPPALPSAAPVTELPTPEAPPPPPRPLDREMRAQALSALRNLDVSANKAKKAVAAAAADPGWDGSLPDLIRRALPGTSDVRAPALSPEEALARARGETAAARGGPAPTGPRMERQAAIRRLVETTDEDDPTAVMRLASLKGEEADYARRVILERTRELAKPVSQEGLPSLAPSPVAGPLTPEPEPPGLPFVHPSVRGRGARGTDIRQAVEQSRAETAAAEGRPLTDAEASRAIQESPFERGHAEAQQQASTPPRPDASGNLGAAGGPASPLDGKPVFDPVVPPGAPRIGTFWERIKSLWGRRVETLLPQEAMIAKRIPQSTVLSDVKGAHGRVQDGQDAIVKEIETLRRAITPDEWIYAEHKAKQMARAGIEPERILSEVHPAFAAYVRQRGARFLEEQTARKVLGLEPLAEVPFPYAPRRALYAGEESVRVLKSNEPGRQMESTLQSFGRERASTRSMAENMQRGTRYEDPNLSVLARETVGMHLRETGQLVQDLLDHNVLFTSAKDAMGSKPGALAVPVQSLYPGARPFWAASREEAVYIAQNFTGRTSPFGQLGTVSRTLLRNPNLTNPFPHEKNMATALLRSGGNPIRTAFVDVAEYRAGADPLVERFKALDGHTSVLRPAAQLYQDEARRIGGGIPAYWTEAKAIARAPLDLNQKILFDLSDPAIRYSLFKTYVGKGLSDQAAWNRAFVDMVNYGTRSTVTDMLSQVPGNFFVPWRVGSLTGTLHAIRDHPFRVALTIGAIDYLREAHYRETGRWFSIPVWDNITRPVTAMIQRPERGWTEAMMLAVSSRLPALWADMMAHKITAGSVARLFWGMAQWGAIGQDFKAVALDPSGRTISNLMMGLLAGERLTETYEPTRLSSVIPETLPGQSYNERVKGKDTVIEEQRRRAELRAAVAARRGPRPTPAQRVGLSP